MATDNRLKRSPSSIEKSSNPGVVDEKEKTRSLDSFNKIIKPPVIDLNAKLTLLDQLSNDELFKQIGEVVISINYDLRTFDTLAHSGFSLLSIL